MLNEHDEADLRAAVEERLNARIEAARRKREDRRRAREEKTTRRNAGLELRHQRKLNRKEDPPMTVETHGRAVTSQEPRRRVTCRYLRRSGEQCTGEALDPQADVWLCMKHTARVVEHARATYERYRKEATRG